MKLSLSAALFSASMLVHHASSFERPISNFQHQITLNGVNIPPNHNKKPNANIVEEKFKAHYLDVPVDHFHNDTKYAPHTNETFKLRYWFDAQYYRWPGPVIVLLGGETSGADRLPFLDYGILHKLAKELNGVGVVLEHRYYGDSFPTANLSVESLRFLDTQQALADTAYFAQNVAFEGLEDYVLTSKNNAWFAYGGSYAGAFAAFLRVLYPDDFYGAISSSGVPAAIIDYWEYWEAIRLYGPSDCIATSQRFVEFIDTVLLQGINRTSSLLKRTFGFPDVISDADFAAIVTVTGVGRWQSRNWDPKVSSSAFDRYCGNVTTNEVVYPTTPTRRLNVELLMGVTMPFMPDREVFVNRTLNWIGFLNDQYRESCDFLVDQCFVIQNESFWAQSDVGAWPWRSWTWQYCTQWGYLSAGSTTPPSIKPIVSRLLTLELLDVPCRSAFNTSALLADVGSINQYGGFDLAYERLAFVDGQADPWRWAGVHRPGVKKRKDSFAHPSVLIEGAVHHWDENALPDEVDDLNNTTPEPVAQAQGYELAFVRAWLDDYNAKCRYKRAC